MSKNVNNGAIRKRRSSILKTKPRAPLAELELNPPTPEASSKSRRVSFSRKTGVAEFVGNEGTTTWRNFYEQNRTLESSGNESVLQPVIAKQCIHFQEVEAEITCASFGNPAKNANITMFSDMNFTEQLAGLDCMDMTMKAPQNTVEVSVMGEKSKVFAESFQNPLILEQTGGIDINFSMMQRVVPPGKEDHNDLSDIVRDVERTNRSVGHSFMKDFNRSCYVEVELNETKGLLHNDMSDMSITDTVQSPKFSPTKNDKPEKKIDWMVDKENISSFARPTSPLPVDDNVLVFDGKKLKMANINIKVDDILNDIPENRSVRKTLESKTILTDDVRVCAQTGQMSTENVSKMNITMSNDEQIPFQLLSHNRISHQMSLMPDLSLVDGCIENPSINLTKNVPGMSVIEKSFSVDSSVNKVGKLLILDDLDLSYKPKVSVKDNRQDGSQKKIIALNQDDDLPNFTLDTPYFDQRALKGFPKNVVFDTEDSVASMSTTQAILREILDTGLFKNQENRHTLGFTSDNMATGLSMTEAVPVKPIEESANISMKGIFEYAVEGNQKQNIVVPNKNNDNVNMLVTQPIPSKKNPNQKRQTIVSGKDDDLSDMSITQANPSKETNNKRQTILFGKDDDLGDMSITQALPPKEKNHQKRQTIVFGMNDDLGDMSITQAIPYKETNNKRQTIVFDKDNDLGDMSITQALPSKEKSNKKRQTIVFGMNGDLGDMSITQVIPCEEKPNQKRQTIVFGRDDDLGDMSITQAIPTKEKPNEKRQTIVFGKDNNSGDMSITQVIPSKETNQKRQTIVFGRDDGLGDMSITQAIPSEEKPNEKRQTIVFGEDNNLGDMSITQAIPSKETNQKRQTIVFGRDDELGDMSITQAIPSKEKSILKSKTVVYDRDDDLNEMLIIKPIEDKIDINCQTIHCTENDSIADMPVSQQKLLCEKATHDKSGADMSIKKVIAQTPAEEKHKTIIYENSMSLIRNVDEKKKLNDLSIANKLYTESNSKEMIFDGHSSITAMSRESVSSGLLQSSNIKEQAKSQQNSNAMDDTNELIDMLTEVTDQMDRDLELSAKKLNQTNGQKTYSDEYLENIINEKEQTLANVENLQNIDKQSGAIYQRESKEQIEPSTHNNERELTTEGTGIKEQSETDTQNNESEHNSEGTEIPDKMTNRLTIAYLLNQSERIKSLISSTINTDKRPSIDTTTEEVECEIIHDVRSTSVTDNRCSHVSREVIKTLNFEDESHEDNMDYEQTDELSISKKNYITDNSFIKNQNASRVISEMVQVSTIKNLMNDLVEPNADLALAYTSTNVKPENSSRRHAHTSFHTESSTSTQQFAARQNHKHSFLNHEEISGLINPIIQNRITGNTVDLGNPLNNITAANVNKETDGEFEKEQEVNEDTIRKFDRSNPLNNISFNRESSAVNISRNQTLMSETRHRISPATHSDVFIVKDSDNCLMKQTTESKDIELLDNTSCVTLVDDSPNNSPQSESGYGHKMGATKAATDLIKPNLNALYMTELDHTGETTTEQAQEHAKKRMLSPKVKKHSNCASEILELTPNPPRKLHKMSNSPVKEEIPMEQENSPDMQYVAETIDSRTDAESSKHNIEKGTSSEETYSLSKIIVAESKKYSNQNRSSTEAKTSEYLNISDEIRNVIDQMELTTKCPHTSSEDEKIQESEEGTKTRALNNTNKESDFHMACNILSEIKTVISEDEQTLQSKDLKADVGDSESIKGDLKTKNQMLKDNINASVKEDLVSIDIGENSPTVKSYDDRSKIPNRVSLIEEFKSALIMEIDELAFMGSWRCEWESSAGDWSFLFLHGHIRLCVRFAPADTVYICKDTPVESIEVTSLITSSTHEIASLCVSACLASMQSLATAESCARADRVAALLSRCARATDDAARWCSSMKHARLHLAYRLDQSVLRLEVANIPLRAVWEVTFRIANEPDGPRAVDIGFRTICSLRPLPPAPVVMLAEEVPPGWDNVPKTLWSVFHYLKHRSKDEELLALFR